MPHVAPHPNEIKKTEDTATEDTATPDERSEGVGKIQSSKGLFSTFAGNKMTEDTDREILSVDPDIPSNVSERAISEPSIYTSPSTSSTTERHVKILEAGVSNLAGATAIPKQPCDTPPATLCFDAAPAVATDLASALPADVSDVSDDELGKIVDGTVAVAGRSLLINSVGKSINRATRALPDSQLRRLRHRSVTRAVPSLLRPAVEPAAEKFAADDAVLLVPSSLSPIAEAASTAPADVPQSDNKYSRMRAMGIDESVIAIKKGLDDDGDRRLATRLAKRFNGTERRRLDLQLRRDSLLARNIDALEQQGFYERCPASSRPRANQPSPVGSVTVHRHRSPPLVPSLNGYASLQSGAMPRSSPRLFYLS